MRPSTPRRNESTMAQDIETKVREKISEQLGVAADEVTPEASFIEDLGADSLDIVELVMALEEEFNIEISDEDAEKIRTVKDVVTYIEAHKSSSCPSPSSCAKNHPARARAANCARPGSLFPAGASRCDAPSAASAEIE